MTTTSPSNLEAVRQLVENAIEKGEATSVALALVYDGKVIHEEAFGYADVESGVKATLNTPYATASITKSFTCMLMAKMAEKGHFGLDDQVSQLLRRSPLLGETEIVEKVTVRMLGAHTSGLPGMFVAELLDGDVAETSMQSHMHDYGRVAFPPGEVYEYGNIGYLALGVLYEEVVGECESFGEALDRDLLQPLEMRDSFYSNIAGRLPRAAIGYDENGKRIPLYRTVTPPSGELYASVHDLARFILFVLGEHECRTVLSTEGLEELKKPVTIGRDGVGSTFGWFSHTQSSGEKYFFKGGGQPGVAGKIIFVPGTKLGCVVITNRSDNMPLVDECCEQLLSDYIDDFSLPEEDAGPEPSDFIPTKNVIGKWRGKVENGGAQQTVDLSMDENGDATLTLAGQSAAPVCDIKSHASAFEGFTSGVVRSDHGQAFGKRELVLKLMPWEGKLIGRITARGPRPGVLLANIAYAVTLERV